MGSTDKSANIVFGKGYEIPKVCVLAGSAYGRYLANHDEFGAMEQVPAKNLKDMLQMLKEGYCNGVIHTKMHLQYLEGGSFKGSSTCDDLADDSFRVRVTGELAHVTHTRTQTQDHTYVCTHTRKSLTHTQTHTHEHTRTHTKASKHKFIHTHTL